MTDVDKDPMPWDAETLMPILRLLAGRWVLPILEALQAGTLRRSVLTDDLPGVSDKVLTETLRRLERAQFITRRAIASVPVEVDYALTSRARTLWPILEQLQMWSVSVPDLLQ